MALIISVFSAPFIRHALDLLPTQDSSHLGATVISELQAIVEMQGVRIRTPNRLRIN